MSILYPFTPGVSVSPHLTIIVFTSSATWLHANSSRIRCPKTESPNLSHLRTWQKRVRHASLNFHPCNFSDQELVSCLLHQNIRGGPWNKSNPALIEEFFIPHITPYSLVFVGHLFFMAATFSRTIQRPVLWGSVHSSPRSDTILSLSGNVKCSVLCDLGHRLLALLAKVL